MHIGLHTGAITSAIQGAGSTQQPQALSPLPGILDAPNIIVLGASIMDSGFGSAQTLNAPIADYAAAAGFTGTLHVRSQSGDTIADTTAKHAAAAAEPISDKRGTAEYRQDMTRVMTRRVLGLAAERCRERS